MIRCSRCGLRLAVGAVACPLDGGSPSQHVSVSHTAANALEVAESARKESLEAAGWVVERELGRGGFATVYAAHRARDGVSAALKVAHTGNRAASDSLFTEALVLETLQGRHAPLWLGTGITADGDYYIAMGRHRSKTLAELLVESQGKVPFATFRTWMLALVDAVEALHQKHLVHRDLKPDNIFIEPSGVVTLIDFELTTLAARAQHVDACMRSDPPPRPPEQDDGGTAEYMSPEQCRGLLPDARADIYALGVIMYEVLSGAPPFWGRNADVREAQALRSPTALATKIGCPAALSDLVGTCLAKLPGDRCSDLAQLRAALTHACDAVTPEWSSGRATMGIADVGSAGADAANARAAGSEEISAVLLYFRSEVRTAELGRLAEQLGGLIAFERADTKVAMFGHHSASMPADAALALARRLSRVGAASRARLHVATVSSRTQRGRRRITGEVLSRAELVPGPDDPSGLIVSRDATYMLRGHPLQPIEGRPEVFLVEEIADTSFTTQFQASVPLVGREQELTRLTQSLADCVHQRRATLCTTVASAGMGKSHLAMALMQRLEPNMEVRTVAIAAQAGDGARLLVALLRLALNPPLLAPADGGQERLTQDLGAIGAQVWPAVALQLGWVDLEHPQVAHMASAPGALHLAVGRALGEALRQLSRQRPLALIIDDAHLADDTTLDALEYATLSDADAPLWIGVFGRPQLKTSRKTWGVRADCALTLELSPLSRVDSGALLRSLLTEVTLLPEQALSLLHERTQGIPGEMAELVNGLKLAGVVRRIPGGTGHLIATDELSRLPDVPVVEWSTLQELKRLPDDLLLTAQLCAVLGGQFSLMEVAAVQRALQAEAPSEGWLDTGMALRNLRKNGMLRVADGAHGFVNPLLGELLYKRMPQDLRKRMHATALEALRHLPLGELEHLSRDARHAQACGRLEQAAQPNLTLAIRLAARHDYRAAERAYADALSNLGPARDTRYIEACRGLGAMRSRLNRHGEAVELLAEARNAAHALLDFETEAHIMLDEAMARDWSYDFQEAIRLGERAAELVPDPPGLLRARCLLALARNAARQERPGPALDFALRAAELSQTLGDAGYETRVIALNLGGFQLLFAPAPDAETTRKAQLQGLDVLDQALTLARDRGDVLHVQVSLNNRSAAHFGLAAEREMLADVDESIRISREAGLSSEVYVRDLKVEYLLALGQYPGALAELHKKRAIAEAFGLAWLEYKTRLQEARAAFRLGDRSQARQHCQILRNALATDAGKAPLPASELLLLESLEFLLRETNPACLTDFAGRLDSSALQPQDYGEVLENVADSLEALGSLEAANTTRRKASEYCARHGAVLTGRRINSARRPAVVEGVLP